MDDPLLPSVTRERSQRSDAFHALKAPISSIASGDNSNAFRGRNLRLWIEEVRGILARGGIDREEAIGCEEPATSG